MSKRVLVTGANGQLGCDVVRILREKGYRVYAYDRNTLDIADMNQVSNVFHTVIPDIVIHAAAYTKVDQAESDCSTAFLVNGYGTRNVAVCAEEIRAKLVYISTDYVFNGDGKLPYDEFMPTDPINVYGKSKLAGETFVQNLHSSYFILRTSWVFGSHGANFVKTMLQLAKERESLSIVQDQVGCPTYTVDLVEAILAIMETNRYGIYHVSNSGSCSWYEFAEEIFRNAGTAVKVVPVTSEAFPRPAKRPTYSVFDHMSLEANGFGKLPHWKDALSRFMQELKAVAKNG
ncbi:dTDP-4-dehydrorhamnose reductase [Gorillibacterium sp. sgz5001074]|uniref:dTDP-4-dehydrorhamnose reductase n=1 Tax=Gorillibacterium sp. sgz5001074 TaxID=3446695 RepID=UPI003F66BD80